MTCRGALQCSCAISAGAGMSVTGAGTAASPLVIAQTVPVGHGCRAYLGAAGDSVANGLDIVSWDSEAYDTDAIHSTGTNPSRFTIPAGLSGLWAVTAHCLFPSNATGIRGVFFTVNGGASGRLGQTQIAAVSGVSTGICASAILDLNAADYFEVNTNQTSGGALTLVGNATADNSNSQVYCAFLGAA